MSYTEFQSNVTSERETPNERETPSERERLIDALANKIHQIPQGFRVPDHTDVLIKDHAGSYRVYADTYGLYVPFEDEDDPDTCNRFFVAEKFWPNIEFFPGAQVIIRRRDVETDSAVGTDCIVYTLVGEAWVDVTNGVALPHEELWSMDWALLSAGHPAAVSRVKFFGATP